MAIDPSVQITFAHREREKTYWLEFEYPTEVEPHALLTALESEGWEKTHKHEWVEYQTGVPTTALTCSKPGTDLFNGWTDDERTTNMARARAILRSFGRTRVPVWSKTLMDML